MSVDESLAEIAIKGASKLGLKLDGYVIKRADSFEGSIIDKFCCTSQGGYELQVIASHLSKKNASGSTSEELADDAELSEEVVLITKGEQEVYNALYSHHRDNTCRIARIELQGLHTDFKYIGHDLDFQGLEASVMTALYGYFG